MFGLSFGELFIIGVVGLIVIGPERLPTVARTLGHLVGRAQRYVNDVKSDIQREVDIQEIAKIKEEMQSAVSDVKSSVEDTASALRNPVNALRDDLQKTGNSLRDSVGTGAVTTAHGTPQEAGEGRSAADVSTGTNIEANTGTNADENRKADADAGQHEISAPAAVAAAGSQSSTAGVADLLTPLQEPAATPAVTPDVPDVPDTGGLQEPGGATSSAHNRASRATDDARQSTSPESASVARSDAKSSEADLPAAVTRSDKHS